MGSHAALHSLPSSRYGSILSISFGIGTPGLLFCPSSFQNHNSPTVFSAPGVYSSKCFFQIDPSVRMICFYQLPSVFSYCQFSETQGRVDWDHHLTVGLQGRRIPQVNMKAHPLLSCTSRLQLSKQCLPSWLSSQAWFPVVRATVCLSDFLVVFLLRLTAYLMQNLNVQRNDLPELLDVVLVNKNISKERGGYSTDVLKSYSVMSTSPQACAHT